MNAKIETFTGKSYSECRAQWLQFRDEQPREPVMVRAEASRTGDIYEFRMSYIDAEEADALFLED